MIKFCTEKPESYFRFGIFSLVEYFVEEMGWIGSYVILATLSIVYFLENYNRYLLAVSVIPYVDYSSYEYSLLSGTIFALCYSAGGVLLAVGNDCSSIAAKHPAKLMKRKIGYLTLACLIFSGSFMLTGLSTNFAELAIIRMIMGFAQSIVTPFCTGIIGEYFPHSSKGFALSVFQLGTYFSFSMSLSLGTYMYDEYGWQYGYLLFGALGMVLSLGVPLLGYIQPVTFELESRDSFYSTNPNDASIYDGKSGMVGTVTKQDVAALSPAWERMNYRVVYDEEGDFETDQYFDVNCADAVILPPNRRLDPQDTVGGEGRSQKSRRKQRYRTLDSGGLQEGKVSSTETGSSRKELSEDVSEISCSVDSMGSLIGDNVGAPMKGFEGYRKPFCNSDKIAATYSPLRGKRGNEEKDKSVTSVTSTKDNNNENVCDTRSSMISVSLLSTRELEAIVPPYQQEHGPEADTHSYWSVLLECCANESPSNLNCYKRCYFWYCEAREICREVFWNWSQQPLIVLVCIATGLRLGAGYIWSSYTSVYFSEQFIENPTSLSGSTVDCMFSYNSTAAASSTGIYPTQACGSDYPYCMNINGDSYTCFQLSNNAWMNKGMSHSHLESYMSWVPLAGSAVGNVLGGIISDKLVPYFGSRGRCLVCGIGNLISVYFVVEALLSEFPNCFLFMIVSGLFGESYLGQSIALLSDTTSARVIVTSVSIFMFIITVIAGNAPLLIPWVRSIFDNKFDPVTIYFTAATEYSGTIPHLNSVFGAIGGSQVEFPNSQMFSVVLDGGGARSLQWALITLFLSLYLSSGLLYIVCFILYRSTKTTIQEANKRSESTNS